MTNQLYQLLLQAYFPRVRMCPGSSHHFVWVHKRESLPALVAHRPPIIPPVSSLIANINNSSDKLFFVSHSLGNPSARQWQLVRVAFADSTALLPSCLQDERFLVDFYTLHYSDVRYNATNQRHWLQYHMLSNITTPTSSTLTHLIRPSDTSEAHAA